MRYHSLGDVPAKRHTQFRENGTLLTEEVMGYEGFSGNESILYHLHSPCRVAAGLDRRRIREAVDVRVGHPLLADERAELADPVQPARRVQVVEDRLVAAEALVAEDLLDEQPAIAVLAAPDLRVALGRNLS